MSGEKYRTRLVDWRIESGEKQDYIAEKTGVSRKTLSLMESEDGCNPQISTAIRVAKYFGKTLDELFVLDNQDDDLM